MRTTTCSALSLASLPLVALTACAPHVEGPPEPEPPVVVVDRHDAAAPDATSEVAESAPPRSTTAPPVSPSLLSLAGGASAAVSDPDTDRVYLVALDERRVTAIDLPRGTEPGRLVEDGSGRVHVVLRRGGGIVTIAPDASTVTRRPTCAAPRGIGWRESDDSLVVACAEGVVVVMPAADGPPRQVLRVADDLRDVVVLADRVLVSRFRSAEVLALDEDGAVIAHYQPATVERVDALAPRPDPSSPAMATFEPAVAWRLIPAGRGAWLLHQRERTTALRRSVSGVSYGAPSVDPSADCSFGMVETALSVIAADQPSGTLPASLPLTTVLATDVTYRPTPPVLRPDDFSGAPPLVDDGTCATVDRDTLAVAGAAVAYAQRRGVLQVSGHPLTLSWWADGALSNIPLAEEPDWSDADTGRSIFQTVQPSRIACMSCHPEGGDDGHVWPLGGVAVRTQSVAGGILATAPFHWEGDLADFDALVDEVLVGRMRGSRLHPVTARAFASWIDGLEPPPRPIADAAAVARGRSLFESAEHECSTCHSGPSYSVGDTVDVGTGGAFQIPVLVGVAYRAPYMHSGCATTLRERFTGSEACNGGDLHGHTSDLAQTEIDDLVAYLRSL